jgi:small redox-active disulfide protein 2
MKSIQILGPGCARCKQLAENAAAAVRELGMDCQVEKVTDIRAISAKGVMLTPALVIDGEVKVSGKVLSADEIKELIG